MRFRLHWTARAIAHIARHGLVPEDIEQALEGRLHMRRVGDRAVVIGRSRRGTVLVVLAPSRSRPGRSEVVSARRATFAERRLFWKRGK